MNGICGSFPTRPTPPAGRTPEAARKAGRAALRVLFVVSALLLASCSRAATPAPSPVPTQLPATATAVLLTDTPTVVPLTATGTAPPSILTPGTTPVPEVKRIQFAPGTTWAIVQGNVAAGGMEEYLVRALAGQFMMVIVTSPDSSVVLEIYGLSDGQPLLRSHMQQASWQGTLSATQDYSIKAVSYGGPTSYALQVIIPLLATPPPVPQVKRIQFAPGAISALERGTLAAGGVDEYMLRALAGQSMTVMVWSPDNNVVLEIYGFSDGQPLLRSYMQQTSWQGVLPSTQDYSIKAASFGGATSYTLQVVIPPLATPPVPETKRIEFAPGATSAMVQGDLAAEAVDEYLLRALAGQWMMAMVFSPDESVVLEIYGISDGQPLVRSHMRQTFWQGPLPTTQDYGVKTISTAGPTGYTLQVIILERVEFQPGAVSGVREGTLQPRETHEYLLRALGGQTMTVTIVSPSGLVLLEIYGIDDGQPLVRVPMGVSAWTGVLPNTQDYDVKAVSVTDVVTTYRIEFVIQ